MLLKKKSFRSILLMMWKFTVILMKKFCWKKFRWKKILIMKKILMRKFWKKLWWKKIWWRKFYWRKLHFFYMYKNGKTYIIKNIKKDSEKKHVKDIKIFLKKKKIKGKKKVWERYQNLAEKKKKKTMWVYEKTLFST